MKILTNEWFILVHQDTHGGGLKNEKKKMYKLINLQTFELSINFQSSKGL